MTDIIAHPGHRFRVFLRRIARRGLARIGCDCPLCGARVLGGGLCGKCEQIISLSDRGPEARCPRCAQRLRQAAPLCADCLAVPPAYGRLIAAADYEPPATALIRRLKTGLQLPLTVALAQLIVRALNQSGPLPQGTVLIAVPSGWASLQRRGMNPAGEIARCLSRELGLSYWPGALQRRRETPQQVSLGRQARRHALTGVFYCRVSVQGRSIALVDDVMTTGSTVNAAVRALQVAGAADVTVLVAARASTVLR